jgi:hypothetical protein
MQGNSPGLTADYPVLRHPPWVKTQCLNRAEFVVVGWSDPEGSRPCVGALLLGYYESDGPLVCAGRVITGMSQKTLRGGRAILWMSHQPMISLRSSAEFIAALASLARRPWISSSRFGDKWSRHASTGSSRALPSLVEDPCRWRLPAPARVADADVTANDDAVLPCGISSTAEKAVGRSFSRASRRLKSRRSVASANGPGAEAHALDQPERGGIFAHLVAGRP